MVLDAVTVRNLELIEPIFAADAGVVSSRRRCSRVLDQTLTGMGGRLLRQRLLRPSMNRAEIEQRLDAVGELLQQTILRAELRKQLGGILDLERLLAKVTLGSAGPRDVLALGRSLEKIPALKRCFDTQQAARLRSLHDRLDELPDVANLILEAIADEPPLNLTDGGTIRAGYHPELDELRDLSLNGRQYIAQIEARERQRTGIQSLKVRFNNVFGYYIEITRANLHLAPADYERKQTLANAERFTTPELKDYERKVLDAEDKILTLEKELFADVRKRAAAQAQRIRATAAAIAELDVTASLAQVAAENRYQRPAFSDYGRDADYGGPASGDRAARRPGGRPLHPERSVPERHDRSDRDHHRAEHGRQVHVPAAGGADRDPGADGVVRAGGIGRAADDRPHLHAHRRVRQPGARALDVHGGDDRDGGDSEYRDARAASSCWTRSAAARRRTTGWRWRGRWWSTCTRRRAPRRCSRRTITNSPSLPSSSAACGT